MKDEAAEIAVEGGAAEKAGAATAVAMDKAHTAVDKVKPKVNEAAHAAGDAVNKGAYATGKQIGKATGMFSEFKEEYDKARGPKPEKNRATDEEALAVDDVEEDTTEVVPDEVPKKKPGEEGLSGFGVRGNRARGRQPAQGCRRHVLGVQRRIRQSSS